MFSISLILLHPLKPSSICDNILFWKVTKPLCSDKAVSSNSITLIENKEIVSDDQNTDEEIKVIQEIQADEVQVQSDQPESENHGWNRINHRGFKRKSVSFQSSPQVLPDNCSLQDSSDNKTVPSEKTSLVRNSDDNTGQRRGNNGRERYCHYFVITRYQI